MEEPDRTPAEETEQQDAPPDPRTPETDDERADREADETFPASDPPANY